MYQVIIVVHVLLGLGIVGLILMQQGKGADAGAAFGSGGSGSVFGAQGSASFLSRTTAIFATLFFTTSLALAALSGKQSNKNVDIMDTVEAPAPAAVDVPTASKTPVPAVSSVTDKPADVPAMDIPVATATDSSAPKVDEKSDAADKPASDTDAKAADEKKADKSEKKAGDKADKKADKSKKKESKSDKKDKPSYKK